LQDDDENPVWDTSFYFHMPMSASKAPAGVILLELWDNNTFKVWQQCRTEQQCRAVHVAILAAVLIYAKCHLL
jgi:hypothetical protein